uniref:DUF389 domain-containing protein n=2 Tax=Flavobacterium sp. TaxID=239 RepID=UPI00404AD0D8
MQNSEDGNFKKLILALKAYLKETLDIRHDTNHPATIEEVKSGIQMKGQAAWVLVFSILIASAGLNTSSTAVVIGAMLISPLMGPILGIGLSLGINDMDLMRKALKNFGVMVFLALATSFLFFSIPIFQDETPELRARTFPDVRDVIIAFAGGTALIVALSRKTKQFNTIAGVAIATALMPPLCTAGYGLATGKWDFLGGALFLFTINTIFIALSTFLVVRFLQFPTVDYVDSIKRKRISQLVSIVSTAIIIPSIFMFYRLYQKSDFEQKVSQIIEDYKLENDLVILDFEADYRDKTVSFATIGKNITNKSVEFWKITLEEQGFEDVKFDITQNAESSETNLKLDNLEKTYMNSQQLLNKKEEMIVKYEKENLELQKQISLSEKAKIPFSQIAEEIKINYENVEELAYSRMFKTNFETTDTIPMVYIKWKDDYKNAPLEQEKIQKWLQVKLSKPNLRVTDLK